MHAFTVDLEEWFHGIELPERDWRFPSRLRHGLDPLLCLLDAHATKATFFVLGAVAERFPHVVAELADEGHEVACHGHVHQFVYKQSRAEFRDDVRRAQATIANATGQAPRGYRAPYFSIRRDSLWALDVLYDLGFTYDSSIFPARNYRYGIPNAPRHAHAVRTLQGSLTEIPLTTLRVAKMNVPFSGGAYLRILPWALQQLAWAFVERKGMTAVAYIHPWELDPEHPFITLPRRIATTHYARLQTTYPRLDYLLSTYTFGRLDHAFGLA